MLEGECHEYSVLDKYRNTKISVWSSIRLHCGTIGTATVLSGPLINVYVNMKDVRGLALTSELGE